MVSSIFDDQHFVDEDTKKKNKFYLSIFLFLPEDFYDKCIEYAYKGIDEGVKKWGVYLIEEDKENIVYHSMKQLSNRIDIYSSSRKWNIDSHNTIKFKIPVPHEAYQKVIHLPLENDVSNYHLFYKPRSVEFTTETEGDDIIPLKDFYHNFLSRSYHWVQTAAFYGVGSLTNS